MKSSVNPNIVNQNTNIEWYFHVFYIQYYALKVSFDIENLIFGNIPSAKKKGFDHYTCNMKNSDSPDIEIRISK